MNDDCLSDLAIDRYLSGELSGQQSAAFETHAKGCVRCDSRLRALRDDAATARESLPPMSAAAPRVWWPAALAVAAGLLLAVALGRLWSGEEARDVEARDLVAATRTKGSAHLVIYLRRDDRVRLFDAEPVRLGDELAFAYTSSVDTHLAVFDVDAGRVEIVFPDGERTFSASAGVQIDLDVAVVADGSPSEESLVAVFCAEPQEIEVLREALASEGELPSGCQPEWTALPKAEEPR